MALRKAVKSESRLRMAIVGPAGSGKTFTALKLATMLVDGKRVALFDTEHGSAAKYADSFDFDVDNIDPPFHPDKFCQAIKDAAQGGYGVVILDSLSHAWNGEGGMLDIVEAIAKRMRNPNSFAAWKDATPIQNRLTEAIVGSEIHVIVTMRSKTEYVLQTNEKGQQQPKKVGMAAIQRSEYDYEFDVVMEMDANNTGIITKTRCSELNEGVFNKPGANVAKTLMQWLQGAPAPKPVVGESGQAPQGPQQEVDFYSSGKPDANAKTQTNADNPFDGPTPPKLGAITKAQTGTLHALGIALYGDARTWDAKRHGIVKAITNNRIESSALLTQAEAKTMIEKLETKIREHYEVASAELVELQAEQPDIDTDNLFGVELANAYTALCKLLKPEAAPVVVGK